MRRVFVWIMLLCMTVTQVHGLVPHHHHAEDAPAHRHAITDGIGIPFGPGMVVGSQAHPEMAPHDEPLQARVCTVPDSGQRECAAVLPSAPDLDILGPPEALPLIVGLSLPYATGPPGRAKSRAPPVDSNA